MRQLRTPRNERPDLLVRPPSTSRELERGWGLLVVDPVRQLAELAGAESMVGLLINTVPVRGRITTATTTTDLVDQLHNAHNHTLEHEHLALSEIHRVTGHDQLFDTMFAYENYPIDAAELSGTDGLAVTELTNREYNHYPLVVLAHPGRRHRGPGPGQQDRHGGASRASHVRDRSGVLVHVVVLPVLHLDLAADSGVLRHIPQP